MWMVVYNKGWNIVRICCLAQTQSQSHYKCFLSYLEYFINDGNKTLRENLMDTLNVAKFPSRSDDNVY